MGEEVKAIKPIFLDSTSLREYESMPGLEKVDIYQSQLDELAKIPEQSIKEVSEQNIFYPWRNTVLRCVDKQSLFALRTSRNKNLITKAEQDRLSASVIGVAGMSVGAGIAIGAVYSGIADHIKLADHDVLDTSNLNRLRESLLEVGQPKVELAARHIYEVNPYAQIDIFKNGIDDQNIGKFLEEPKLDVVVDEIDDFKMKVKLRLQARQAGIPLIMFTSLGDNILIDIERYDQEPNLPIFHGLLKDLSEEILQNPHISPEDIRRFSVQLVGQEYIPTRALQSVAEMGKTLVGRPQLYSTIAVDGGLAAFVIRKIILGGQPKSGRYFVKFNELINLSDDEFSQTDIRKTVLGELMG